MPALIISADDHVDLSALPPDLFQERLEPALRAQGPRVVTGPSGTAVWTWEGKIQGPSGTPTNTAGTPYATTRAGLEQSGFRAAIPALRLADMDRDGIQAQVIYGPPHGFPIQDPALKLAVHRAFNDWAAEFNRFAPDRLCLLPILPVHSPAIATAELRRCAGLGHRGAMFQASQAAPVMWDPAWEVFWSTAEEAGMPLSIHLGGGYSLLKREANSWLLTAVAVVSPMQLDEPFSVLVMSGILDRHPRLKVVLTESGLGWLPYFIERMDLQYRKFYQSGLHTDVQLSRLPSQICRDQVLATFEEDRVGVQLIPLIGEDNVMWASDYPHPDSTFPNSRAAIAEAFHGLPERLVAKVTGENCARLYGFLLNVLHAPVAG